VESGHYDHYAFTMGSWAIWYRNLFLAWVVIGLPSLDMGYGFSGGDLEVPTDDVLSFISWAAVVFFLLSPILLWRWRKEGRKPWP
jgi:hypothetical protein